MYAVMVSEMQKDLVAKGAVLEHPGVADAIVPGIQRLLQTAREVNVPVIYNMLNFIKGDPLFEWGPPHCLPQTKGSEIIDELQPEAGDYLVDIYRMNHFLFSNFEHILRMLKIDTLVITGINTNAACLLTAVEAFQLGFDVIMVTDCCGAWNEEKHQSGLSYLRQFKDFIEQLTLSETIDRLEGKAQRQPRRRWHDL
jgi:nicotinamidase-related amidase